MKKIILLLILIHLVSICNTEAKKWTVSNKSGVDADGTTIQAVHDLAAAGDTIYVEGSSVSYGDVTLTTKVYLFGTGYFLGENPETQANLSPAYINYLNVNSGSEGSLITGFYITRGIDLNTSQITIIRNYITGYNPLDLTTNNLSNILILQNYIVPGSYNTLEVSDGSSNVMIHNNYIYQSNASYNAIETYGTSVAYITNNVIYGNLKVSNSAFTNNIYISGTLTESNNTYFNNLCNGSQFPSGNGNQQGVTMTEVFVSTGSTDGKWQLSGTSPALSAGLNGEDCGMFGGPDPYVLSGIPHIPSIYFFSAPSSASEATGLPVHIKVKSNK